MCGHRWAPAACEGFGAPAPRPRTADRRFPRRPVPAESRFSRATPRNPRGRVVGGSDARRRRRRKMRSTPAVGGDLFGGADADAAAPVEKEGIASTTKKWKPDFDFGMKGQRAEIIIDGETFDVRLNAHAIKALRSGFSGDMLDSRGISINNAPLQSGDVTNMLSGYVRNASLSQITEEPDSGSDTSSLPAGTKRDHQPPV